MDLMDFLWWRRRRFIQSVFIFWISSVLIEISEACSTRGAPKPRSPSRNGGMAGSQPLQQATAQQAPNVTIPHFDCPSAYQKWYCLNQATCFAVKIGDTILYNCRCAVGFQGQRCEYKDTDESYNYVKTRTLVKQATIAGVTTAAIFIVIIVITAITIYLRRRREKQRRGGELEQTYSVEAMQRTPFGRTLSRTEQFSVGRSKNPSGAHFAPLPTGVPSTSRAWPQPARILSEQESLLTRVGMAPVARTSDASLSNGVPDEVILTMETENSHHIAHELPHPYSLTSDGAARPAFTIQPPQRTFTTGS